MGSRSKKFLTTCSILILFIISSTTCFLSGMFLERTRKESTTGTSTTTGTTTTSIEEQPVYYNQTERYFDENSPSDVYQALITDAQNHFTFEFKVSDQSKFESTKDFILANLENQYDRLSVKFNRQITAKITIRLVDDVDVFSNDLGTGVQLDPVGTPYSAYALGGDLIEIFINPIRTADKFEIAHAISHELVHIFQYLVNSEAIYYTPNWFIEGMAESFAYPKEEALINLEISQTIPDLSTLESMLESPISEKFTLGYDTVAVFFNYLVDTYEEEKLITVLNFTPSQIFESYFEEKVGVLPDDAYAQWLQSL